MILLDVNILVYAHRFDLPLHPPTKDWLDQLLRSGQRFGIPQIALQSVIRVSTNLKPPSPLEVILDYCQSIASLTACEVIHPSDRHWEIFDHLCRVSKARGNLVTDAYLAAFAIDRDTDWITVDADFAKFPGLRWRRPWENHVTINPR